MFDDSSGQQGFQARAVLLVGKGSPGIESSMIRGLGLPHPFWVSFAFSTNRVGAWFLERRHGEYVSVDMHVRNTTLPCLGFLSISPPPRKVEPPLTGQSNYRKWIPVPSCDGSVLDVLENPNHAEAQAFSDLRSIQEKTQLLRKGEHKFMDRRVIGLPTTRTDHLLPAHRMQSIHKSLTVLSGHLINSPVPPGTADEATNGRVHDLADVARRSEIRFGVVSGGTGITEGSGNGGLSRPHGRCRVSGSFEVPAGPQVSVDSAIPKDGRNLDCVVVDLEAHGSPVVMKMRWRLALRTTFREDRSAAVVGPEMWAAVLSHFCYGKTTIGNAADQYDVLLSWYWCCRVEVFSSRGRRSVQGLGVTA